MSAIAASWETPDLLGAYARAGGGGFDQSEVGAERVLRALVDLLPHGSAAGKATAAQVADAAGMSVRWARHCLHLLEDMGLITWRRGGVIDGKPQAGWITIIKANLARLIRRSRDRASRRRAARAEATRERLQGLHSRFVRNVRTRNPKSIHAELSSPLRPLRGGTRSGSRPDPAPQLPIGDPMATHPWHGTPCIICNHIPERCEHANGLVPKDQRHEYQPSKPTRVHQIVAPIIHTRDDKAKCPPGWRHQQDILIEGKP